MNKTMSNIYKKASRNILWLAALAISFSSCTKDFEDFNTDNTGVSDGDLKPNGQDLEIFFRQAQMAIYNFSGGGDPNSYQVQQNLNADCFSGYFMSPTPFNSGQNNLNYAMVNSWNGEPFKVLYLSVLNPLQKLRNNGLEQTYPALWGAALVVKVAAASRVTDIYGPIPYSQVGRTGALPYDSQQDIYNRMFLELDTASNLLKTFVNGNDFSQVPENIESADLVYSGADNKVRFQNWLHLANSLRLRLAMRIVKVDQQKAREEAEKALDPANGGVITDNTGNFKVTVPTGANYSNPLFFIAKNWGDIRMNAALESYMVGYHDPRISKYMDKSTDPALAGAYKGIRIGAADLVKDTYINYSSLNTDDGNPSFTATTAPMLMTAAEVTFLRAEAALRGWSNAGGSAQSLYEQGIQLSFSQWGTSGAESYIQDASNKPIAYVDPKNARNNAPAPTDITIQWNEGANNEQKLERIITQKWLAIFPEGQEAWSEFRRTGYPKLFPVVINNSGGQIDTQVQIRRLPFSQNEYNTNAAEVQKAIGLLGGGADNGGTRLWWDKDSGNF